MDEAGRAISAVVGGEEFIRFGGEAAQSLAFNSFVCHSRPGLTRSQINLINLSKNIKSLDYDEIEEWSGEIGPKFARVEIHMSGHWSNGK
jgi:hypothetical protein